MGFRESSCQKCWKTFRIRQFVRLSPTDSSRATKKWPKKAAGQRKIPCRFTATGSETEGRSGRTHSCTSEGEFPDRWVMEVAASKSLPDKSSREGIKQEGMSGWKPIPRPLNGGQGLDWFRRNDFECRGVPWQRWCWFGNGKVLSQCRDK